MQRTKYVFAMENGATSQENADDGAGNGRIVLGLLEFVEKNSMQSHRRLASELGIALGLTNVYVKRCVSKGLLKVSKTPARRYMYFLTPKGFAEKSRLTSRFLSKSLSLFRHARVQCTELFSLAKKEELQRFVLMGISDVAEIALLCAMESNVTVVGVVDSSADGGAFMGFPVYARLQDVPVPFDAIMVTDVRRPQQTWQSVRSEFYPRKVLVPAFLGVNKQINLAKAPS